jgi:hypothetical protein
MNTESPYLQLDNGQSYIQLDNGQWIRVVEEGREGSTIFVRQLQEKETDTNERIKYLPGENKIVLTTPVYAISLHTTGEVGRQDDILTWFEVVPDGREGSTVYCRTLLPDEQDKGLIVQLRPGDNLSLRPNALVLSVDAIDKSAAIRYDDGYASITNTIWTILSVFPTQGGKIPSDEESRFLITAARRLDASHKTLVELLQRLKELNGVEYSIRQRNLSFEIIGFVEIFIVAMNRSLQMASSLNKHFSINTHFPEFVRDRLKTLRELRNSYEHIDDRALGFIGTGRNRRCDPNALSIFDFQLFFERGVVSYANYELDIHHEALQMLIETREYLKEVTSELTS